MNAPGPRDTSGRAVMAADALGAPRRSDGSRLTAFMPLGRLNGGRGGDARANGGSASRRLSASRRAHLRRAWTLGEGVEVPVDEFVAHEQADEAAEGEPGAERD